MEETQEPDATAGETDDVLEEESDEESDDSNSASDEDSDEFSDDEDSDDDEGGLKGRLAGLYAKVKRIANGAFTNARKVGPLLLSLWLS